MNTVEFEDMENLLFFFILVHPTAPARKIYKNWTKDKTLCEYEKPEEDVFLKLFKELKSEVAIMLI